MRRRDLRDGAVAASDSRRAAAALLAGAVGICAVLLWSSALPAAELAAAEARGKYIYEAGRSRARRVITANLQRGQAPAPASILPCVNCHGVDGRGADDYEGIAPLDINWYALSGSGAHRHSQRSHAAFDERSVQRAITEGIDPDGNELDSGMPRYNIADADMADLIAYLKVMDSQSDPGLSATAIRLGTVLPTAGPLAGMGDAMQRTLQAYLDRINSAGGVHGRRLELVVGSWGANGDPSIWSARDLVDREAPFALISGYVPNYDAEYEALATEKKMPLIGPYTALPPDGGDVADDRRYAFYSTAGLQTQLLALVEVLGRQDAHDMRLAVVYPRVQGYDDLAHAARQRAVALAFAAIDVSAYPYEGFEAPATVSRLATGGNDAVLFLGSSAELVALGRAAEARHWIPYLLAPGLLAEHDVLDLPKSFSGRVMLAYAALPGDYTPQATAEFEALHAASGLDYRYSAAQVSAYTAARIAVEALQNAGRNLSRERLMAALETMNDFHPGLVPAVSFGPQRRIGSGGAHVVHADLVNGRLDAASEWIDVPATAAD